MDSVDPSAKLQINELEKIRLGNLFLLMLSCSKPCDRPSVIITSALNESLYNTSSSQATGLLSSLLQWKIFGSFQSRESMLSTGKKIICPYFTFMPPHHTFEKLANVL